MPSSLRAFERFRGRLLKGICVCPDYFLGHLACLYQLPGAPHNLLRAADSPNQLPNFFRMYIGAISRIRANLATDLDLGGRSFSVGKSGPRLMIRILS